MLDFVEAGEEGDGDEDHDCFFAVADFDLWGGKGMVSSWWIWGIYRLKLGEVR